MGLLISLKDDIDKIKNELEELKKYDDGSYVPLLPRHILDFLSRIEIVVYGETKFERRVVFGRYSHLFNAQDFGDGCSHCLVGIEDLDEGQNPDGWTDILLPIFYSNKALNQCGGEPFTKYIFYVDTLMSGAYKKEFWFFTQNEWRLLFTYEANQIYIGNTGMTTCVGYIEYDPVLDVVCCPSV